MTASDINIGHVTQKGRAGIRPAALLKVLSSRLAVVSAVLFCLCLVSCSEYFAAGTFQVGPEDFKTLYTLKGEKVLDSLPGTIVVYKLWQDDDLLVAADIKTEKLHVFSFPGFVPVKTVAMPYLISSDGLDFFCTDLKGVLCGIRNRINGRIDLLTESLELQQADSGAVYARPYNTMSYDDILPTYMDRKHFWFSSIDIRSDAEERSLYRTARCTNEAVKLYSLNLAGYPGYNMKFFPWGISAVYKRGKYAVYAYEQFKVLKFMKMDGSGVRTLDFFKYAGNYGDSRWNYIQGYYRGQVHVGRNCLYLADFEFGSGNLSRIYGGKEAPFEPFTMVQTYSFTGEPQCMYRLDREGHLMVDGKGGKFYIIDNGDYSVRSYDIPEE